MPSQVAVGHAPRDTSEDDAGLFAVLGALEQDVDVVAPSLDLWGERPFALDECRFGCEAIEPHHDPTRHPDLSARQVAEHEIELARRQSMGVVKHDEEL